jgi:hypothetical protein
MTVVAEASHVTNTHHMALDHAESAFYPLVCSLIVMEGLERRLTLFYLTYPFDRKGGHSNAALSYTAHNRINLAWYPICGCLLTCRTQLILTTLSYCMKFNRISGLQSYSTYLHLLGNPYIITIADLLQ